MSIDLKRGFLLGPWSIEPLTGSIGGTDGEFLHLEPKVMDVLVCLAAHANELVTREQLLTTVWPDHPAADELLTGAISDATRRLRGQLGKYEYLFGEKLAGSARFFQGDAEGPGRRVRAPRDFLAKNPPSIGP